MQMHCHNSSDGIPKAADAPPGAVGREGRSTMREEGKPAVPGNRIWAHLTAKVLRQPPREPVRGHHDFGDQLALLDQGWGGKKQPEQSAADF